MAPESLDRTNGSAIMTANRMAFLNSRKMIVAHIKPASYVRVPADLLGLNLPLIGPSITNLEYEF